MKPNKYVHAYGDGRVSEDGKMFRDVFLNGEQINHVVYADTKRGIVRVFRRPIRLDKHMKRVLTKTLRGNVEVKFK